MAAAMGNVVPSHLMDARWLARREGQAVPALHEPSPFAAPPEVDEGLVPRAALSRAARPRADRANE
jgi:hypothetical protein